MAQGAGEGGNRPPLARELGIGLAVFAVYTLISALDWPGRRAGAERHGEHLLAFERALHVDPEQTLNAWLAPHAVLRVLANYEYASTYVISSFVLLFWVYARRPAAYRWARTSFVLLNLAALVCFAAWPLMPPRLLPGSGFVDTVRLGHTWLSWGSPLVAHANQLAAMPSLHIGWAMWVSAVLALVAGRRSVQVLSAGHVLLTLLVILATGNHYLLDAVGGAVLVTAALAVTSGVVPKTAPGAPGARVPAADLFFLRVETPDAPQHVGGVVLMSTAGADPSAPTKDQIVGVLTAALPGLPRWRQRLSTDSPWRRPHWVNDETFDLERHVEVRDLRGSDGGHAGLPALHALVGELSSRPLPRDRPLWQVVIAPNLAPGCAGLVLLVHHVLADGMGAVAQALTLLETADPLPDVPLPRPPGLPAHAAAVAVGLAQLATDGPARARLPRTGGGRTAAGRTAAGRSTREFSALEVPFEEFRALARAHRVRVTDVLLAAVAAGLERTVPGAAGELRAAVPLLVRPPDPRSAGNGTAAVMVDVPLRATPAGRLRTVASRTRRLRRPTRVLASRFVQAGIGELLPARLHTAFARAVYGPRFLSAVVSNMAGPPAHFSLAGLPMPHAYPLVPVAPRTGLAVGALGWGDELCLGISTDPTVVAAESLAAAIRTALSDLREAIDNAAVEPADQDGRDQPRASISLERA